MKKEIVRNIMFLKKKSEKVSVKDAKKIIKDLEDTLAIQQGLGLSAIQIGVTKNVGIVRVGDTKIDLINPIILEKCKKFRHRQEGCLSFPQLRLDTVRYRSISIENDGKVENYEGLVAVVIQHEVDHMTGIIIMDRKWRRR